MGLKRRSPTRSLAGPRGGLHRRARPADTHPSPPRHLHRRGTYTAAIIAPEAAETTASTLTLAPSRPPAATTCTLYIECLTKHVYGVPRLDGSLTTPCTSWRRAMTRRSRPAGIGSPGIHWSNIVRAPSWPRT